MKRIVSLLLALAVVLAMCSLPAMAEEPSLRTIRILSPENENQYIKISDREEYPIWQILTDKLAERNIRLELECVPHDQYKVTIQTRLASGNDLPDIVGITEIDNASALNLAQQGVLLPINEILLDSTKAWLNANAPFMLKLSKASDGNNYWYTNIMYGDLNPVGSPRSVQYRVDWLEKLGLQAPATAEEFTAMCRAFRENDVNGDGQANEVVYFNPARFLNGVAQWFGLGSDYTFIDPVTQKVTSPWYQPGIKDYIQYMRGLVDEGIMDVSLIGSSERLNQTKAENRLIALATYASAAWNDANAGDENAFYGPILPLRSTEAAEPILAVEAGTLSWYKWGVTNQCTDTSAVADLLDFVYSDEYMLLCAFGIEGDTYDVIDGKPVLRTDMSTSYSEENAAKRRSNGAFLWGGAILPNLRWNVYSDIFGIMEKNIANPETVNAYKLEFKLPVLKEMYTWPAYVFDDNSNFYAQPDETILEEKLMLTTDLSTYSSETLTALILGERSMDEWDDVISELKALGLDRLIEINQELYDRYMAD